MMVPRWARALLRGLAPSGRADDVIGDLEEAHGRHRARRGPLLANLLTALEALDMAFVLLRGRLRRHDPPKRPAADPPSGARGRRRIAFSWLDVKLGLRMLVRYPGLTLVGGLAMAFAIWVGAAVFELAFQVVSPSLPLDEGDRIVGIRSRDLASNRTTAPTLHEFFGWREELDAVEDLGAYRTVERNLVTGDGRGEPLPVAEISAAALRVARVPPLMGRALLEADQEPGAPAVVVIGYGVWKGPFAGDPDMVGRTVRLGRTETTVVGVMPEGFAFPVAHDLWMPLRLDPLDYEWGAAPRVSVLGRLRPGVALDEAQAEVAALGLRLAADRPQTHEHVRPEVVSYPRMLVDVSGVLAAGVLSSANVFVVILLTLLCGNVALLMFARAATREREIVVRSALGASRSRIVGQLFAEAMVLGTIAAAVGLGAASFGLRWGFGVVEAEVLEGGRLPFWFSDSLSAPTILYAVGLALLGAIVAGVVPALRITGKQARARLQRAGMGGSGPTFGRLWSVGMIVQVAATVVFTAVAWGVQKDRARVRGDDSGITGAHHLTARLEMDREPAAAPSAGAPASFDERYEASLRDLEARLLADPAVTGVTFADRLPRMYHDWRQVEVEGGMAPPPDPRGHRLGSASVDPDFFDVLGGSVVAGRGLDSGDVGSDHLVVVVNQSFVDRILGGRNPVGERVRDVAADGEGGEREPGPWHEIVGVVEDLGGDMSGYGPQGMYHPMELGRTHPVHVALEVRGDPVAFGPRLSRIAIEVEPTLRLENVLRLDRVDQGTILFYRFWFRLTAAVSGIALLLSLTAIYSVMSFAVSRRTREIGIRVALGSSRRRVVLSTFRRPVTEVALGIALGSGLVWLAAASAFGVGPATLPVAGYGVVMMAVCMLSCIVPTRRALGIEPTEALKVEG